MKLTILMPCLNESETLATCITKANDWIIEAGIDAEVLIADNGSTDGSQDIARALGARVVEVAQKGYGSALYHGVEAAMGRYVIMGDSDDSYDFSRLDAFVEKLDEGYDLVMGNRFAGGIEPGAMPWKNRHVGNPVLTLVGRVLFRCPAKDFHCGIRGFTKEAFERMDLRTSGMEFASEIVIKATLLDMSITEVPTTLSRDGRSRPPHLRPWRDGWRHLRFMLLFSPRWLFLIPGLVLLIPSLVSYLILLSGPAQIGSVSFDVHTLFFAQAGMILGFTTVSLGVIVRMFAAREGLLRQRRMLQRLRNSPVLELGGITGIALIVAGIWVGADLLVSWSATDFGRLRIGGLLRSVSLSTTLVIFGGLMLLLSLIMGFLSLPTRNQRYEA